MNSRAQALLARLAWLALFSAGLGLAANSLFLGISSGRIAGPALRAYDLMREPVGFVLVAAAWTAMALICFVGCAAFLWALVARSRHEREVGRKPRSRGPA